MSDTPAKPNRTTADTDLSGRQLGDFRLLRRLGRGAMADVYLAEQCRLKRRVAVKILKPELAGDRTYLLRFEREAQAAASLVHANIVQIHEVGRVDDLHYIAQEYVEGQNLREWLVRHGPPDLPHALSVMRQVAAALAKAAEQGVIHRDIKPENIMLTRSGEVKVADFGLARLTREGETTDLTQIGITMGTPLYMSPEQVEGKQLDPRSDIYSLGVTCYHMLTGSPPFSGETALGVAVQHLKKDAKPLESVRPDLPPALCRTVHKMLAKSPDQRYPSARELLRELRRLQVELCGENWPEDLPGWDADGLDLPDDPRLQLTQQLDGLMKTVALYRPRRVRWLWLAAGLAATFLVGGAIAHFRFSETPLLVPGTPQKTSNIPPQTTAMRQLYLASQVGSEEAWQAVRDYFPNDEYCVRRAEQQLAQIHLREGDYVAALQLFDKFAAAPESQPELRAFGLAGQCGVLTLQGKYRESANVFAQLFPIRDKLQNRQMQQMVERAIRRDQKELGPQSPAQFEQFLRGFDDDG
jgi:eukaryotic-like serine/threonine-protein kinase